MARKVAFMNYKGGVGKTVLAVNIGAVLSTFPSPRNRVLIIDMDTQANASSYLFSSSVYRDEESVDKDLGAFLTGKASLSDVTYEFQYFTEAKSRKNGLTYVEQEIEVEGGKTAMKTFQVTKVPNLKIVPAYENLGLNFNAEEFLASLDPFMLKNALASLEDQYDYIFFDCPPSFSKLSQLALLAADYVVVPIKPGEFEIYGLTRMLKQIDLFNQEFKHKLDYKVVMNLFRAASRKHAEYYIRLQSDLPEMLLDEAVALSEDITESIRDRKPLIFNKKDSGVRGSFVKVATQLSKFLK